MAKFSDIPPEIAEQIVQWVEVISQERVDATADALMGALGGARNDNPGGPPPPPGARNGPNRNNHGPGNNPGNNPFQAFMNLFGGGPPPPPAHGAGPAGGDGAANPPAPIHRNNHNNNRPNNDPRPAPAQASNPNPAQPPPAADVQRPANPPRQDAGSPPRTEPANQAPAPAPAPTSRPAPAQQGTQTNAPQRPNDGGPNPTTGRITGATTDPAAGRTRVSANTTGPDPFAGLFNAFNRPPPATPAPANQTNNNNNNNNNSQQGQANRNNSSIANNGGGLFGGVPFTFGMPPNAAPASNDPTSSSQLSISHPVWAPAPAPAASSSTSNKPTPPKNTAPAPASSSKTTLAPSQPAFNDATPAPAASSAAPKKPAAKSGGFFANFGANAKSRANPFGGQSGPASSSADPSAGAEKKPAQCQPQSQSKAAPAQNASLAVSKRSRQPSGMVDDMPEPVPVSPPHSPGALSKSKLPNGSSKAGNPSSNTHGIDDAEPPRKQSKGNSSQPFSNKSRRDSDDDMPALEAIIDPPTYTGKKPELATSKGKAAHVSEDDDMPSFEPLDQPKPKNKGKQPAASSSAADKKPSTPAAGPSSNNSNTSSSTSAKQFASKKEVEEDDDDMPALEPFDRAKSSSDPDSARHAALNREPEFKRRMHMALSSLSVPPETIDQFREEEGEREADEFDPNDDLDDEESDHCPCYSCMLERMEDGPPGDASRAEARDSRLREIARRNGLLSPSGRNPLAEDEPYFDEYYEEDDYFPDDYYDSDFDDPFYEDYDEEEDEEEDEDENEEGEEDAWETEDELNEEEAKAASQRWVPQESEWKVDPETWSYPDGLPTDPILPLMLVSRPFLYAARKTLYSKMVTVNGPWQLSLLLRTLKSPQVSPFVGLDDSEAARGSINNIIKSLTFHVGCEPGGASLGRGGIRMIADTIEACDRVKFINLLCDALASAWGPLSKALKTAKHLETLNMRSGSDEAHPLELTVARVAEMAEHWPKIKNIDFYGLSSSPFGTPVVDWPALTNLTLVAPDITGKELQSILKHSVGNLQSFALVEPANTITRTELADVLTAHAPHLKDLCLQVSRDWQPRSAEGPASNNLEFSPFLLNCLMSRFKKLETLNFLGPIANSNIFTLFPTTLGKLSWGHCPSIEPRKVAGFLSTPGRNGRTRLPNLTCASVVDDDVGWSDADFNQVQTQLRLRDACFHNSSSASVPLAAAAGMNLGDGNFLNFGMGMPPVV